MPAAYCSVEEARAAGADGADAEVLAAVHEASDRVDTFTGGWWAPRTETVRVRLDDDGWVRLPRTLQTIDSIAVEGGAQPYPYSGEHRIERSSMLGGRDRLALLGFGLGLHDDLRVGWESYRTPHPSVYRRTLAVTGTWGTTDTPDRVRRATALLAAGLTVPGTAGGEVNAEGDADLGSPPRVPVLQEAPASGTGSDVVDALLLPLRHALRVS